MIQDKEEEQKIGVKKIKKHPISVKVYFYEICVYYILFMLFFIILRIY